MQGDKVANFGNALSQSRTTKVLSLRLSLDNIERVLDASTIYGPASPIDLKAL